MKVLRKNVKYNILGDIKSNFKILNINVSLKDNQSQIKKIPYTGFEGWKISEVRF